MEFHAQTIMQHANFAYALPYDTEMEEVKDPSNYDRDTKSLILLHGLTGTDTDWLYGGVAQMLAYQYNLAVFMPTTGNSFYLDHGYPGGNYASYIGEELPDFINKVFGFCESRENTIIGGLSMGGYGAIHTALAFPERFASCIGLSSALVIKAIDERFQAEGLQDADGNAVQPAGTRAPAAGAAETGKPVSPNTEDVDPVGDVLPLQMLLDVFGGSARIAGTDRDPEALYLKLKKAGTDIPKLYFAVGTEDSLLEPNREFAAFLEKEGADYTYEEGPGKHDWFFWNEYIERGLKCVL